jgi:hypothetical protein
MGGLLDDTSGFVTSLRADPICKHLVTLRAAPLKSYRCKAHTWF